MGKKYQRPRGEISLIPYLCTAPWGGTHGRLGGSADTPCPAPCGPEDTPPNTGAGAGGEARRSSDTGCCCSHRTSSPSRSGDTPGLLDKPCGEAPVSPVSPATQILKHGEETHGEATGLRNASQAVLACLQRARFSLSLSLSVLFFICPLTFLTGL